MAQLQRAVIPVALALAVAGAPGCVAFNQGIDDGYNIDRASAEDYGWYHEIYEMPMGIVGFPLFAALAPVLYWIPDDNGDFGYVLGRAFGRDFVLIDPTENYESP
ncbi:MAG: hypothetical protein HY720_07235 [Planctomycetes bacterium]|nr:hypothetical protein [Planctomycetota bacterium]